MIGVTGSAADCAEGISPAPEDDPETNEVIWLSAVVTDASFDDVPSTPTSTFRAAEIIGPANEPAPLRPAASVLVVKSKATLTLFASAAASVPNAPSAIARSVQTKADRTA